MFKTDLSKIAPCTCGSPKHPHIHCGECEKAISLDGAVREGDCQSSGIHTPFELKNDWCDCDDHHVETSSNGCVCGVVKTHVHCLGCGKIKEVKE